MTAEFYRAFEERHRGTRTLIKDRLTVYLPFIDGIKALYADARALDLGCGRGEWLELLAEHGVTAEGVDYDAGMISACREAGLPVTEADALEYLWAQPAATFDIISAFHVVEHIPFSGVQDMVAQALRVLRPGGLLILETPNPDNLVVGASSFYLDPTHVRPLPAGLLGFLPDYYGFARQRVMGLQEPPDVHARRAATLANVLCDVSPDYAVIAQAPASAQQLSGFDELFERPFGTALTELAGRFDEGLATMAHRVDESAGVLGQLTDRVAGAETDRERLRAAVADLDRSVGETRGRLAEAERVHEELHAVYASTSWRITRPLRQAMSAAKHARANARKAVRAVVVAASDVAARRPALRRRALAWLNRCPRLKARLKALAYGRHNDQGDNRGTGAAAHGRYGEPGDSREPEQLPRRARGIYRDLLTAIAERKRTRH